MPNLIFAAHKKFVSIRAPRTHFLFFAFFFLIPYQNRICFYFTTLNRFEHKDGSEVLILSFEHKEKKKKEMDGSVVPFFSIVKFYIRIYFYHFCLPFERKREKKLFIVELKQKATADILYSRV